MIQPGEMLGVLGGGQLGRMFAMEALRMGYRVLVFDPDPNAPAAQLADVHIARPWNDPGAISEIASRCAAVTIEFENIPAELLRALAAHLPVRPHADAVAVVQDRIAEKTFLNRADVPTARWAPVRNATELTASWDVIAAPAAILKTSRLGYDGKGQVVVESRDTLAGAWDSLGNAECILEQRVDLACEISVMVARGMTGDIVTWSAAENVHRNGILHTSVVPSAVSDPIQARAGNLARQVVEKLDYVGVMGVECFITHGSNVLVNEVSPRPHNSGHWTIDACVTNQFEQQVRCTAGAPLGATTQTMPVAMVNVLGDIWANGAPNWEAALQSAGVRLHLYGKLEARAGRKMGHLTALSESGDEALHTVLTAWDALTG